ncbi:MAG: DNA repair protein RadA [Acidimicrobiales bacterium]
MATRTRTVHRCTDCGAAAARWAGRCGECGTWNSLVEQTESRSVGGAAIPVAGTPMPIVEVTDHGADVRPTGLVEVDRVLGGGMVAGSVILLGGEPGVGKSTLLLQLSGGAAVAGRRVLYVSGEESPAQVRARADRLGALHEHLWLVPETVLAHVLTHLDRIQPELVVIDSIQTMHDPDLGSAPGSVTQVRTCAHSLVREAKERGATIVLVGHVTKDGNLAGPRVLEHIVDTVLSFEGDRHHALRLLRASKHRFGPTTEVGLLRMDHDGLAPVDDPSELFLADRVPGVSGSAVVPTIDGRRPRLIELQALVAPSSLAQPRRSAQGVDPGRLALLLAVLERRVGLSVSGADVYALAVGGARINDPGADAALALAVASSLTGHALPGDLVVLGEVGLGGELRHVLHVDRRLDEAARLGFGRAIVPTNVPEGPPGMSLMRAPTLAAGVALAEVGPG